MILVTGGTGLVGSYILLQLTKKDLSVRALIRKNTEASKKEVYTLFELYEPKIFHQLFSKIEWIEGDMLNIPSLEKAFLDVSQVYHAAGKVSFIENETKELYKTNIEGTQNMINLSIENRIDKFCFISTIAVLDPPLENSIITENAEWNFKYIHSAYACSKYGAEMEVWRGSQEGLKVIIVNPGVILGSGNWDRSSGELFKYASKNIGYYTSGTTGYVDAEDVAKICALLMEDNSLLNEKYILISENVSYKKVFQTLRTVFNKKPAKLIPDSWLKIGAFFSIFLPIKKKLNKAVVNALTGKSTYSNKKIVTQLNYNFISVEKSLKKHSNNYLYRNIKNND